MNYISKFLLPILAIVPFLLLGQTTNWTYIANDESIANCFSRTTSGDFLIVNKLSGPFTTNNLVSVSRSGDLNWKTSLDAANGETIIYATEISNQDLILVTAEGKVYRTDANGQSPTVINQLSTSPSTQISGLRFRKEYLDKVYFIGSAIANSSRQTLRSSLDLETFEVRTTLGADELYPNNIAFSNTGLRAELISEREGSSILFYNANLEITTTINLTQPGIVFFSDLSFDKNGNLYVVGTGISNENFLMNTGVVGRIDSNRVLRWIKEIPRPSGYESLGLKYITAEEDRIFIGGRSGPTTEHIEGLVGEIDTQGNLLWEKTIDISNNNEEVISLEYVARTSAAELIALGTGGLVDFGGPQRTFLTSISIMTSSTHNEQLTNTPLFYPNPVDDILYLDLATAFEKIEVRSVTGVLIDIIPGGTNVIDMSGYSAGLYFLRSYIEDFSMTTKVIKK